MSNFITPPILKGTEKQQLLQLRDYLFQLQRQLTTAVNAVENGDFSLAGTEKIESVVARVAGDDAELRSEISQQAATLKTLIINTADVIYQEMDQIVANLESTYVAQSDFGEYQESISAQFVATAESVTQQIDYAAGIAADANSETNKALQEYIVNTNGFIRQGIVGYNGTVPIIGIAIGQDIQTTGTDTKDGIEYPIIDTRNAMSTFTSEKLSFYLNGVEVAYVSNSRLFITDANITNTMTLGNWEINHNSGFTIKWIGA